MIIFFYEEKNKESKDGYLQFLSHLFTSVSENQRNRKLSFRASIKTSIIIKIRERMGSGEMLNVYHPPPFPSFSFRCPIISK